MFTFNIGIVIMGIMIVAIEPSLVLISITEDMECSLDALNKSARPNQNQEANTIEFIQQFNKFIKFHSNAKQLSASLNFRS